MLFRNRMHAGQVLAKMLQEYGNREDVVVLALPRGGVPVAFEIASALHAPLDVFLVRKLGVPGQEELAMGAIATGGIRVLNNEVVKHLSIPEHVIDSATRPSRPAYSAARRRSSSNCVTTSFSQDFVNPKPAA